MTEELQILKNLRNTPNVLTGRDKKSSLHTSWRARVFTRKGKLAGFPDSWRTFQGFKENIPDGFKEGRILVRKNSTAPFSKENAMWIEKADQGLLRLSKITYAGKTQTTLEWCAELELNYSGLRQRLFKGKNFTPEQVLFGKDYMPKRTIKDLSELDFQRKKNKVSKMLSSYRHKDKVRDKFFDLDNTFLADLMSLPCYYCGDTKLIGADRINNEKGHTKDNVLPCCYTCNVVRNSLFTVEEMKLLGKTVRAIKQSRQDANN